MRGLLMHLLGRMAVRGQADSVAEIALVRGAGLVKEIGLRPCLVK
jgi:hypothetical protein